LYPLTSKFTTVVQASILHSDSITIVRVARPRATGILFLSVYRIIVVMKRKHHLIEDGPATFFITSTVAGFKPIFNNDELAVMFLRILKFNIARFDAGLHAFVVMPNHFHLLLSLERAWNISTLIGGLKSYSSRQIIRWSLNTSNVDLLNFFISYAKKRDKFCKYKVWETGYDELVITEYSTLETKLDYIHNNPLQEKWHLSRKPSDYRYSSARFYETGEDAGIPITPPE
jgi:putative transposase